MEENMLSSIKALKTKQIKRITSVPLFHVWRTRARCDSLGHCNPTLSLVDMFRPSLQPRRCTFFAYAWRKTREEQRMRIYTNSEKLCFCLRPKNPKCVCTAKMNESSAEPLARFSGRWFTGNRIGPIATTTELCFVLFKLENLWNFLLLILSKCNIVIVRFFFQFYFVHFVTTSKDFLL